MQREQEIIAELRVNAFQTRTRQIPRYLNTASIFYRHDVKEKLRL